MGLSSSHVWVLREGSVGLDWHQSLRTIVPEGDLPGGRWERLHCRVGCSETHSCGCLDGGTSLRSPGEQGP